MARFRTTPYTQGQTVALRGPKHGVLTATAPDGLTITFPPATTGKQDLWLPQPGTWTYTWDQSPTCTLEVAPAPTPDPTPPARTRW